MLSWWSDIEAVALVNNWMLLATVFFSMVTGVLSFLTAKKSRGCIKRLSIDLENSRKQFKSLEKAAEEIRRELLQTQQHQDINQLRLKSSKSSAQELGHALLDAQNRLEAAEKAVREQEAKATFLGERSDGETDVADSAGTEALEPVWESENGLTESRREQLMDLLDPGPKGNVDIFCVLNDDLSVTTANHLESILSADGWKTSSVTQSAFADLPEGLILAVNSKETAPSYASFLQRVFATIGLPVSAKIDKKYREWSLTVIVGTLDKGENG